MIGAGRMGLPICERLMKAGHLVTVHDIRPEVADRIHDCGAQWQPLRSALRPEMVITVLPGSPELQQVMEGDGAGSEAPGTGSGGPAATVPPGSSLPGSSALPDRSAGLLQTLAPGTIWLDLTSADPDLGIRLAAAAEAAGLVALEAPMGGGVSAARTGELTLYAGGPASALDACWPVLETIAGRIVHLGPAGSGYLTKLMVNVLWFSQAVATTEVLLLAERSGIGAARLRNALAGGPADGRFIAEYLPKLIARDPVADFGLDRVVEELDSLVEVAESRGVPFELGRLVADLHEQALSQFGPVDGELLVAEYLRGAQG